MDRDRLEIDLHRLELRFSGSRLVDPAAERRIAHSIGCWGQIVPCIVVSPPDGTEVAAWVLVDGYRRVAALRRLGRDTVLVETWRCELTAAVLEVLARRQDRPFAGIEEALLLRELMQERGLSQNELARGCGRDVSWVSRRLQLLSGLPDAALAAVRAGRLSAWAASRVMVPLARANATHAEALLARLAETPLSTRELRRWFEHYQLAARAVRERMVSHPHLFLEARQAEDERRAAARLRAGPEGECLADLRCLEAVLDRLTRGVRRLPALPPALPAAVPRLRAAVEALARTIAEEDRHDPGRDPRGGARVAGAGPEPARDQPPAGAVAQHGPAPPA